MAADTMPASVKLSDAMRDCLWTLAQHKYGWAYANWRTRRSYEALTRRGLAEVVPSRDDAFALTDAGLAECERRFPVSPAVLGTYEPQPGGWTPREGVTG